MQIGKKVVFVDKSGKKHDATVTAIGISGDTGKTLDLTYDGGEQSNVAHGADHAAGEGFWLLLDEEAPPVLAAGRKGKK
jgi:hypothetical protein